MAAPATLDLAARAALDIGSLVDVLDLPGTANEMWRHARVIDVDGQNRLLIHYIDWGAKWDEKIERTSERIQRSGSRAVGHTGKPPKLKPKPPVSPPVAALPVDSYSIVKFVETVPSHLECAICTETVLDPPNTPCGHLFCRRCLEQCRKQECPNCRKPFPSVASLPPNTFAQQLVWNLKVKCSVNPDECPWQGELGTDDRNLKAHHLACNFRTQPCDMCNEQVQIRLLAEHKPKCSARRVNCHYCREWFEHRQLAAHQTVAGADSKAPCANTKLCPNQCRNAAGIATVLLKSDAGHAAVCSMRSVECALCAQLLPLSDLPSHVAQHVSAQPAQAVDWICAQTTRSSNSDGIVKMRARIAQLEQERQLERTEAAKRQQTLARQVTDLHLELIGLNNALEEQKQAAKIQQLHTLIDDERDMRRLVAHVQAAAAAAGAGAGAGAGRQCNFFVRTGRCKFGDNCKFAHPAALH